jgi:hypothetical protein
VSEPVISIHKDNNDQDEEFETLDDGQVVACKWASLKDAADESGQPLRTIRDWATDRPNRKAIVQSKRESDAFNAKILVWLPDVMREAAKRADKEKTTALVPVFVLEEQRELLERIGDERAGRVKAEQEARMQADRVKIEAERGAEYKRERDEAQARIDALMRASMPTVQKQVIALPAASSTIKDVDETVTDIREDVEKEETPKRRRFWQRS